MVVFRPRSSKLSIQKVFLRPFHCKPRISGVSLASPGLENIAKILENRAEVAENHDARKAVWKISPKFGEIELNFVKITMRVNQSRLLF